MLFTAFQPGTPSYAGQDNVTASLTPMSGVGPYYVASNNLPDKTLTSTSTAGFGLFANVDPGDVEVTMTHAVHSCGILDEGRIVYGGEACGYVLRLPGDRALYFAGDTNVFTDMQLIAKLYAPELAVLPIGDLFTMSAREAAEACRLLKARKIIPMHFGTFPPLTGRPDTLAKLVGDGVTVLTPEPGKPTRWS